MSGEFLAILVGCSAVTYLSRIAGFYAGDRELSDRTQRILAYVPVGAFVAIVTLGLTDTGGELDSRMSALFVAAVLSYRAKPIWLCLVAGLAIYAAIEWAL